jgi:hypothetical protein
MVANSEDRSKMSVKLGDNRFHTANWVRILDDGRVELELYDFSPAAEDAFGNDVAWMYRIAVADKPQLYQQLARFTRQPVTDDPTMLAAIASRFDDVWKLRDWLTENGIPWEKEFDSWA